MQVRKLPLSLLFTPILLSSALTSCAATVNNTDLRPMVAGVRPDPPRPNENRVYVDFRDLTGEPGLEDAVFDALEDAVLGRGWELTNDYYSANHVLWADLRLFGEAGTAEGDAALNQLGAVAAGAAIGYGTYRATDNWWLGAGAATASGTIVERGMEYVTREKSYQMVIDLVLGRKIEGGVERRTKTARNDDASSQSGFATEFGSEGATSEISAGITQDLEEKRVHFDLEQRLLATASGRRLTKEMAREALIPRIVAGLKSQIPRVRS